MARKYPIIVIVIALPLLFFLWGCKPAKDEDTIGRFFSLLKEARYDDAVKLTEGNAETLMRKLTKEQPEKTADIVFRNMVMDKISKDELLASKEKDARVYRAGYHIELKGKDIHPEVKELLLKVGNGEVLVYIGKKTGRIAGLIDLRGGVFVAS